MKLEKTASYKPSINSFEASHFLLLLMSLGPLASFQIKELRIHLSPLTPRQRRLTGLGAVARILLGTSTPQLLPPAPDRRTDRGPRLVGRWVPPAWGGPDPLRAAGGWRLMRFWWTCRVSILPGKRLGAWLIKGNWPVKWVWGWMAGQEDQLREDGKRRGTPAALSTHSGLRRRADSETGKDLP